MDWDWDCCCCCCWGGGVGEDEVDGGWSRLGRDDEVGVMMAELARRGNGADGSRGDAMVDMVEFEFEFDFVGVG